MTTSNFLQLHAQYQKAVSKAHENFKDALEDASYDKISRWVEVRSELENKDWILHIQEKGKKLEFFGDILMISDQLDRYMRTYVSHSAQVGFSDNKICITYMGEETTIWITEQD